MYAVLELSNKTISISNLNLYINATVNIPDKTDVLEICVFDSIAAKLTNVTVFGQINVVGKVPANVTFSRFAGRLYNDAVLENIS